MQFRFKFFLILIIICFSAESGFSQAYSASTKIDSARIELGGQTNLQLKVFVPADAMQDNGKFIQFPEITDTLTKQIEIVEAGTVDTVLSADKKTFFLTQNFVITSFDTGFWVIPPFRFLRDGDSTKFFETQAILLEVKAVQIDTTQAIMDIKPPIEIPFTFHEALPYIIGAIILAAVIFFTFRYFRRRKEQPLIVLEKEAELPPHIVALQKLEELKHQKLWQSGKVKEYHSFLTEIVREYLERSYKINALEQTTSEIMLSCRSLSLQDDSKNKLQQMLSLADMVKFAKIHPIPAENELSMSHAFEFINSTVKVEDVKPEEKLKEVNTDV